MLQRILVAVVGIPLLLFVLIIAPDWATALLLCALCTVGAHELLAAACRKELCRRWWGLSAIMGVTVVLRTYLAGIGQDGAAALMEWLLAAWLVLLFVSVVVEYGTPRALAFCDGRLIADRSAAAILCDPALIEQAALKETSLYTLANRCGIAPAEDFVERFIAADREVRADGC